MKISVYLCLVFSRNDSFHTYLYTFVICFTSCPLTHRDQSKHKINRRCDFTVSSYLEVTVYLKTHGSVKHPIHSLVRLFVYMKTILVKVIFTETLKISFSYHFQEYSYGNKRMRPLITRIVCTHTVYCDNWILVIVHFWPYYISFTWYTLLLNPFFWYYIYINYWLTILSKNLPCFA